MAVSLIHGNIQPCLCLNIRHSYQLLSIKTVIAQGTLMGKQFTGYQGNYMDILEGMGIGTLHVQITNSI